MCVCGVCVGGLVFVVYVWCVCEACVVCGGGGLYGVCGGDGLCMVCVCLCCVCVLLVCVHRFDVVLVAACVCVCAPF